MPHGGSPMPMGAGGQQMMASTSHMSPSSSLMAPQHASSPTTAIANKPNNESPVNGPPQMSLALLIEFIVQKTYHDLTVLSELLPRKTDMERKVKNSLIRYTSPNRYT